MVIDVQKVFSATLHVMYMFLYDLLVSIQSLRIPNFAHGYIAMREINVFR